MLKRYLQKALIVGIGMGIFGLCFTFVKVVRADAKEAERLAAVNSLIHCGIDKMSVKAKQAVAESEYQRKMAVLVKDSPRITESENLVRPIFAALVDSCEPADREQRREALGWFKYSLEHDEEYRSINAPLAERYRQASEQMAAAGTGAGAGNKNVQAKEVAWVFRK